jgi:hypothetical protein
LHLHFSSVVLPVISVVHSITSIILISDTYYHYCDLM